MKKNLKITILLIVFIVFTIIIPNKIEAGMVFDPNKAAILEYYQDKPAGIFEQAKGFLESGSKNPGFFEAGESVQDTISNIFVKITGISETSRTGFEELIDVLWSIGLLLIFVSTIILGIKYMLVLPEERSRIKQATTPYVLGVVIIFGAVTIWRLIIVVLDGSLNS